MPRKTLIVLAVSVAVLLVAAAGVFAYDETQKDTIAEGVTVGGVDVGGQTEAEARARRSSVSSSRPCGARSSCGQATARSV